VGGIVDSIKDAVDDVADVAEDIGHSISDAVDNVGHAFDDAFSDFKDFADDSLDYVQEHLDEISWIINPLGMLVETGLERLGEKLGGGFEAIGNFAGNLRRGVSSDILDIARGALEGDWTMFRDGLLSLANAAIGVLAVIAGAFTANPALIASGIIMLDQQYNKSSILSETIDLVAAVETGVFGSDYIEEYAAEIQMSIQVAAALYASYEVMTLLSETDMAVEGFKAFEGAINIANAGYGAHQTYTGIESILEARQNYKSMLDAYRRKAAEFLKKGRALTDQWFRLYTDHTVWYEAMAGGELYNGGAGSLFHTVTDIYDPSVKMHAMANRRIRDLDRMSSGREDATMAGSSNYLKQYGVL